MIDETAPVFPGGDSPQAARSPEFGASIQLPRESKEIRALG